MISNQSCVQEEQEHIFWGVQTIICHTYVINLLYLCHTMYSGTVSPTQG